MTCQTYYLLCNIFCLTLITVDPISSSQIHNNDILDITEYYAEVNEETRDLQPRHVHIAYGNTTTDMVVTWSTKSFGNASTIEWGTDVFNLSRRAVGNSDLLQDEGPKKSKQWIHRVNLKNLDPDTTYFYHVGGPHGWSAVFGFKTVPSGTQGWNLRLAIFGDLGVVNGKSLVRIQQEAHQGMYDAVIHVGDIAYDMHTDNGEIGDTFMRQIEPIAAYIPYMTCPGNHEHKYDFLHYKKRFSMPNYENRESLYYSFDIGPVHFIALSTEVYYFGGRNMLQRIIQQYEWFINDLKAATTQSARKKQPWIIVFGHRPMYCTTEDNDDCTNKNCRTRVGIPFFNWFALEPLLAKYGVDLAIWAHEHIYERMYPMYNYTVMKGSEEQPYVNPRGPVHFTTGSAGCREKLDTFTKEQPEWSAKRIIDYGYTRLTVHNDTHLYWEQVSEEQDGWITDRVWLVRENHEPYYGCLFN